MNEAVANKKELLIKEYGTNIYKLAQFIKETPDKEKRTEYCKMLIKLIEKLNPSVKYAENSEELLWGHLYILTDMELDANSPFPKPIVENKKPDRLPYPTQKPKFAHYGRNVELLANELKKITNEEDKAEATIALGKLLKVFYKNWNSESIEDNQIAKHISQLTDNYLSVSANIPEDGSLFNSKKINNGNHRDQRTSSINNAKNRNNQRNRKIRN